MVSTGTVSPFLPSPFTGIHLRPGLLSPALGAHPALCSGLPGACAAEWGHILTPAGLQPGLLTLQQTVPKHRCKDSSTCPLGPLGRPRGFSGPCLFSLWKGDEQNTGSKHT